MEDIKINFPRIIHLQAENIKRLVAIDIHPDAHLVQITGKNGNGKTSVLDSIWWCLAGVNNVQKKPIRTGADEAYVTIDLGEMIVTRTFKYDKNGETTSSLRVENKDGVRFSSPQAMLDKMLGDLTFDPLAFARMDAKKQFNLLRLMVPGVDFEAIDMAQKSDFDKRTEINRKAKESRAAAAKFICLPKERPEGVDDTALVTELANAGKINEDIEVRKTRRENLAKEIKSFNDQADVGDQEIIKLMAELEETRKITENNRKMAKALQDKLDAAPALPARVDVVALQANISESKAINEARKNWDDRAALNLEADRLEEESKKLTDAMNARTQSKQDAIAAAKIPVKGISFGDGEILLDGQPFDQASDAEQLRASLGIAMALNPKLRVIRVRDGSLLDDDSMKIVEQMAIENNFQIFVEKVDASGKVGIVMEAGLVQTVNKSPELENF